MIEGFERELNTLCVTFPLTDNVQAQVLINANIRQAYAAVNRLPYVVMLVVC